MKWQITRKEHKGKNSFGEKIEHVWFTKTKTTTVEGIEIELVLGLKKELWLNGIPFIEIA